VPADRGGVRGQEWQLTGGTVVDKSNAAEAFQGHWDVKRDAPIKAKTTVAASGEPFAGSSTMRDDFVGRVDPEGPRKPMYAAAGCWLRHAATHVIRVAGSAKATSFWDGTSNKSRVLLQPRSLRNLCVL
jgi:hypothetical protein